MTPLWTHIPSVVYISIPRSQLIMRLQFQYTRTRAILKLPLGYVFIPFHLNMSNLELVIIFLISFIFISFYSLHTFSICILLFVSYTFLLFSWDHLTRALNLSLKYKQIGVVGIKARSGSCLPLTLDLLSWACCCILFQESDRSDWDQSANWAIYKVIFCFFHILQLYLHYVIIVFPFLLFAMMKLTFLHLYYHVIVTLVICGSQDLRSIHVLLDEHI